MAFELAGFASCPDCGNQELKFLPERDHIERLYSSPISRIQGLLGAKLYHCIFCRLQFYDMRPRLDPAEIEKRRHQSLKTGPKIQRTLTKLPEPAIAARPEPPALAEAASLPAEAPKQVEPSELEPPSNHRPASAVISQGVRVTGQVSSTRDLHVDGEVDGCIDLLGHDLTVGPSAKVHAKIVARTLTLQGTSVGDVEVTGKLTIDKTARLTGNIRAGDVDIEDGAYFNGSIEIVEPKTQRTGVQRRKAATKAANTF